ncbi:ATPase [Candidatus Gracilibacteria bacterium]|nr:MAG: ATPase [Candidatus Gracilibacteria bacterium]
MESKNKDKIFLEASKDISLLISEVSKKIVGQKNMIRDIIVATLCKGHILLEGAPGLAKTQSVNSISEVLNLKFKRIQFTPDLLPSDLIGAKIYNPDTREFSVRKGPVFSNLVLADEINRAPSKVQSALLESMEERQVTLGDGTFVLDSPFVVLATQNPIEQEGTYKLPEAQLDRFLLKTIVSYPSPEEEIDIMKGNTSFGAIKLNKILTKKKVLELQKLVTEVYVDDHIYEYVRDIIIFTRENDKIKKYLSYGASPRASISLIKASKALAVINGRDHVIPEDIKEMAKPVLRHRVILSYESIADEVEVDDIIQVILDTVEII